MSRFIKRRWFRFSLRVVMIVVTGLCVAIGIKAQRARDQHRAVEVIASSGGEVYYAHQRILGGYDSYVPTPGPEWLRRWLGDHYFQHVVRVDLSNLDNTRQCFAMLPLLPGVEELVIDSFPSDPDDGYWQGWSDGSVKVLGVAPTDQDLKHLKNLKKLRYLAVYGGDITDDGLAHLAPLSRLERLEFCRTRITGRGLAHLKNLSSLKLLDLRSTRLNDQALAHVEHFQRLDSLFLGRTHISDEGLQHISGLHNLCELDVAENNISDAGLAQLAKLTNLRTLLLNDTRITEEGFKIVAQLPRLERLHLNVTNVTDSGLEHLTVLKRLESLDLRGTGISDSELEQLAKLASLKRLEVSKPGPSSEKERVDLQRFCRFGRVSSPRTSKEGIARLRQLHPGCDIRD